MALYSIRKTNTGHRIAKFDDLLFVEASYEVNGEACSCPARFGCKHPNMVEDFELLGKVDTGAFWNSTTGEWEPPIVEYRPKGTLRRI